MGTFFTADLHFGHNNIITYCSRPFVGVEEMNAGLMARWNSVVGDDDTVHVLGDVALGSLQSSLSLVSKLSGHKILYPGNHDRCWYGHGESSLGWEEQYRDVGFEEIRQGPFTATLCGRKVLLCHLPYEGDSGDTERYHALRPPDHGGWLLHGHVHNKWRQRGRMINVGVDVWDYSPVSEEDIGALMDATAEEAGAA